MGMTVWRIYGADIEKKEDYFLVTTFNMFGREVEQLQFTSETGLQSYLDKLKEINKQFEYVYI